MRRLALAIVLFVALPAQAARVERARLSDLVKGADLVVLGRALAAESYWDGGRILTRVRVDVDEVWAGSPPTAPVVEVVTLGGVVGGIGQQVSGEAAIVVGARVVLFLARQGDVLRVLGLSQGLMTVVSSAGEPARVERRLAGLEWTDNRPIDAFPSRLDDLRARVLELRHAP